ncbi:MAG TPA: pseudouridine synthase [Mycobacteriales bacterium]|jgi:23S rRNA pseudouridine2605 synthase|nr:pseudouridine synthase [Mycobacteriales bacterium]
MTESSAGEGIRLNKLLAGAGVASRRASDNLIAAGRVSIDGEIVREHGVRVDPDRVVVRVDGARVELRDNVVHLALNKPRGVLTAMSDDRGRPTVADLVAEWSGAESEGTERRLFHVGRLDADSEGLLIMTNDGELAHRLTHPSYEVRKTYLAEVPGPIGRDVARRLLDGVVLEDGPARADRFRVVDASGRRAMVELVLHEGRKHIVRRMLAEVGHPVSRLVRTAVGPVLLGGQRAGVVRPLTAEELGALYALVGM